MLLSLIFHTLGESDDDRSVGTNFEWYGQINHINTMFSVIYH